MIRAYEVVDELRDAVKLLSETHVYNLDPDSCMFEGGKGKRLLAKVEKEFEDVGEEALKHIKDAMVAINNLSAVRRHC